ncbi:dihydroorotase [Proteus cibarius]|uniref:Dihydroorotase n=1 Tax=Proteus terrae subsp. cibarius TaxID=626774 RepID=A0A6G6SVH8_9GAMM|nr:MULTISPECIES: dihydroorotase [Proteus]MBG2916219.1 dihydroorotase [Proteus terrae subsp. cibarius]MBG3089798.1 dihydroorotase [Proteus terrae subsp. cibarius]MBG6037004.1 dihydroorotase [Proteus terrae subsp. cibarius]MCM2366748.1 dihydroorotase [Proteus sp. FZP2095]MCO4179144.1 dihydroorotase [Proteus terrae]
MTTAQPITLTIRRPDDWHVHFRDDDMLKTVVPYTSRYFGRAIVMPNLVPPVTTIEAARTYRDRITAAIPTGDNFEPLMTCYLTDSTLPSEVEQGFLQGVFTACKLYPANATTNSSHGVSDITKIYPILSVMEKIGMPLLIHGEVTASNIDIFDREARFIDGVMSPVRKQFPELKIVFEHITTKEAAQYVLEGNEFLGATITPQHLMFNRNHMLVGGVKPHLYCLPILKRNVHQEALREAVASGNSRFFLGTDSAPHLQHRKESSCGCAGVFNAPTALAAYATVFKELNALQNFEAFCSLNGPRFYGLPVNEGTITLTEKTVEAPAQILCGNEALIPFLANENIHWDITVD